MAEKKLIFLWQVGVQWFLKNCAHNFYLGNLGIIFFNLGTAWNAYVIVIPLILCLILKAPLPGESTADEVWEFQRNLASIFMMVMGSDDTHNPIFMSQFDENGARYV